MQPCNTVAKFPLHCASYGSIKILKISASEFGTMRRQVQAWADELLDTVTEDVVHGVYKVVTQSSFSVTWQHNSSGGE